MVFNPDERATRTAGTVELDRAPGTATLYRRAVLGALPLPGQRRVPDTLPETTLVLRGVRVEIAKMAAYNRVCGFRLADALPPTYPHVLAFPLAMALMSGPDFPLPVIGLVHIANRIEVRAPIDAGEPLDLAVYATDLRPHHRGRQFDVVATASVGGVPVWRGVSTYLRREGGTAPEGTRPGDPDPARQHGEPVEQNSGPARQHGEPVEQNSEPADRHGGPAGLWRVAARTGPDYAAVSGDRNPIHTSRLGARLLGFRRPIAHGMWSKARCLAALHSRLPDTYTVEVLFKAPIALPSTVAFAAVPTESFALRDARSGRAHLTGVLTPAGN